MTPEATEMCCMCQQPLTGSDRFRDSKGKDFHWKCHVQESTKRISRSAWKLREDILEKNYREMRQAIDERNKAVSQREAVKADIANIRNKIRDEEISRIRAASLLTRLRLLFGY